MDFPLWWTECVTTASPKYQPTSLHSSKWIEAPGHHYKEQMCDGGVGKTENREVRCTERQNWRRAGGNWGCLWALGNTANDSLQWVCTSKAVPAKEQTGWHTAPSTVRFFFKFLVFIFTFCFLLGERMQEWRRDMERWRDEWDWGAWYEIHKESIFYPLPWSSCSQFTQDLFILKMKKLVGEFSQTYNYLSGKPHQNPYHLSTKLIILSPTFLPSACSRYTLSKV